MGDAWAVVVETEPEWDDTMRNVVLGLATHDRDCCPGCGLHKSVHRDKSNAFTLDVEVCSVCRSQDIYARVLNAADDEADPHDPKTGKSKKLPSESRPADGRHVYMRSLTPSEIDEHRKTTRRRRKEA
jgi:hypothetical protein